MIKTFVRKFKNIWKSDEVTSKKSKEEYYAKELGLSSITLTHAKNMEKKGPTNWALGKLRLNKRDIKFLREWQSFSTEEKLSKILDNPSESFQAFVQGMKVTLVNNKKVHKNSWKYLGPIDHKKNVVKMIAEATTQEQLLQAAVYLYYVAYTDKNVNNQVISSKDLERIKNVWETWQPENIYSLTSKPQEMEQIPTTMLSK